MKFSIATAVLLASVALAKEERHLRPSVRSLKKSTSCDGILQAFETVSHTPACKKIYQLAIKKGCFNGLNYQQIGQDIDGEAANDQSGRSVSLASDGQTVAIGATFNDGNGTISGHVRVYERTIEDKWSQIGQDIDGEAADDFSGGSVSLAANGKTVAIGARLNGGINGTVSGHVRVYERTIEDKWSQIGQDIDGEAEFDLSGQSVSLASDGQTVAIGAHRNDGINGTASGHVRVYKLNECTAMWLQIGQDIDGERAGDFSGFSVSLSDDGQTLAIGAPLNDGINGTNSGHVRIYGI